MINQLNLQDALPIIIKNDIVFEELKRDFPAILADLVTFKSNPNCSCRGRVMKFFNELLEKEPEALNKYVKDPAALTVELNNIKTQRQQNNYSGRIMTVQKGEEAWKSFATDMNNGKFFRAFSVVERENELVVYFL